MNILLIGGSGLLGTELQKHIKCFAPTHSDLDVVIGATFENTYDVIIHCAAYTDVAGAESNTVMCYGVNVLGTCNMMKFASRNESKFVFISTDYVYPGTSGNYSEEGETKPVNNYYSRTKHIAETMAMKYDFDKLIIRTSFKPSKWPYTTVFDDIYTSADYVDIIGEMIAFLVSTGANGVYNVGTERKSLYELAKRRNQDVEPASSKDWPYVNMPKDCSMNCSKYEQWRIKWQK
jgi:dTDP-4-dehydrorhamnose reductase